MVPRPIPSVRRRAVTRSTKRPRSCQDKRRSASTMARRSGRAAAWRRTASAKLRNLSPGTGAGHGRSATESIRDSWTAASTTFGALFARGGPSIVGTPGMILKPGRARTGRKRRCPAEIMHHRIDGLRRFARKPPRPQLVRNNILLCRISRSITSAQASVSRSLSRVVDSGRTALLGYFKNIFCYAE